MSSEITQEERERVIKDIKAEIADDIGFSGLELACVFGTDFDVDESCWQYLLDLIESVPAKKNMRAVELADKLEKGFTSICYDMEAIGDALGYDGRETSISIDMRHLVDAIRNLDIQEQQTNYLPLPTDKNGNSVDVGDVCFKETGERVVINRIYYYGGNNIFAFDTQDKKIKPSEIIKAKEPRNFYALKNELAYAAHYDTNLLTSYFKDIAAFMLPEIQGAEDEEASEV